MNKKKRIFTVVFAIWLLVSIDLASKTFDDFRSGKPLSGSDDTLTLRHIIFPSLKMRDQE
jgi:hypothetical protein